MIHKNLVVNFDGQIKNKNLKSHYLLFCSENSLKIY